MTNASKTHPTVLVVDDDDVDRERVRRALHKHHTIAEASSLASARTQLRKSTIDAAVVDYRLPDGTGLELLEDLARHDIPAVFTTGVGTEHVAAAAFKQGCLEYLSKDQMSADSIRFAVAHVLEKALFDRYMKEKRRELNQYAKDLEAANEELRVFASIVAHDLLEPLHSVETSSRKLAEMFPAEEGHPAHELIQFHGHESKRAAHLVRRLLEYARVDRSTVSFEPVDLGETVRKAILSLQASIEQTQAHIHSDGTLPVIEGDPVKLHQLFQNILGNSLKHARTKGLEIKIAASELEQGRWEIMIQDNGPGIDQEHLEELLSGETKIGIGLEICKKVVSQHRGTLEIASRDGQGTTVRVTIPRQSLDF